MAFRSQLEILVICEYHLQELHLWSSGCVSPVRNHFHSRSLYV